jgi:hypothetical membrane protein
MTFDNGKVAGTFLLIGGVQFNIFLVIAETLYPGYNVANNVVSDLGVWGEPSAPFFDTSAIIFGLMVVTSSFFLNRHFKNRLVAVLMCLAGVGAMGVGVFPENVLLVMGHALPHFVSAALAFIIGGIAAISFFRVTRGPFRYVTVILGASTLLVAILYGTTGNSGYLGIGQGGMERMMLYPTLLALLGFGGYLMGQHIMRAR